jgi:hypothetical protein
MLVGNVPAVATVFVARAVIFSDAAFRDSLPAEAAPIRATPVGASVDTPASPVHNSPQPFDLTFCFLADKDAGRISSRHTSAYTVAATPRPAPRRAREPRGAEQERIKPRAFEWR